MNDFLYAKKTESDYENFYATCPYCGYKNIFNRVTDLETTKIISFKKVQCLDGNCEKQFNINGDMATFAYEAILFDCGDLFKQKKYSSCILNSVQAFEVFFSNFFSVILIFKLYDPNIHRTKELNELISLLRNKIKTYTYKSLKNIFLHLAVNNIQPTNFEDSRLIISNLSNHTNDPPDKIFENVNDLFVKELLQEIKASNLSTLRNKVVHKLAYRATSSEAEKAIKEARRIIFNSARVFNMHKYLFWFA